MTTRSRRLRVRRPSPTPLAPAEGKAPEPDDTSFAHCCADYPQRFNGDRTIRIEVIQGIETDRIKITARNKFFQLGPLPRSGDGQAWGRAPF
jgi:hypothetical protein